MIIVFEVRILNNTFIFQIAPDESVEDMGINATSHVFTGIVAFIVQPAVKYEFI